MTGIIPEQYVDLLHSTALAHIATVGPTGAPQSSPVWFGWDGTFVRFAQVTGYTQKVRNLERDPRVALSIVDPANAYRYLEIRGKVERIEPDPDWTFINSMTQKYLGQDRYPVRQAERRMGCGCHPARAHDADGLASSARGDPGRDPATTPDARVGVADGVPPGAYTHRPNPAQSLQGW